MSFSPVAQDAMKHSIEKAWTIPAIIELPLDAPLSELVKVAELNEQYLAVMKRVNDIYHTEKVKLTPIKEEKEE